MPIKELIAEYKGHTIRVRNTWLSGATLLIDDGVVDKNSSIFALDSGVPFLSSRLEINNSIALVEVYFYAMFTVKMKICVDKKQIAGEVF